MSLPLLPRTLILDYFDSYTNNILTLFTQLYPDTEVLEKVVVVKTGHWTWDEFRNSVIPNIDCIILSPGPGRPDNPSDIGFALELIRLHPVPILGICLGHQAIATAFGGKIVNTPNITHGHVISVRPVWPARGLFASPAWSASCAMGDDDESFEAVVYNSLTVEPVTLPQDLEVTAWSAPSPDGSRTIQGLAHRHHPIWGVQYHPESISSTLGSALLRSYLEAVNAHLKRPSGIPNVTNAIKAACSFPISSGGPSRRPPNVDNLWPTPPMTPLSSQDSLAPLGRLWSAELGFGSRGAELSTAEMFRKVVQSRNRKEKAVGEVWLDGKTPTRCTTSSLSAPSFLLTYSLRSRSVILFTPNLKKEMLVLQGEDTFWDWFAAGQTAISARFKGEASGGRGGWKGGWIGWFGYEMKEESLQRRQPIRNDIEDKIDACWAWADHLLERTVEGEWVARGVIREGLLEERTSCVGESSGSESLINWLNRLKIPLGSTRNDFDHYAIQINDFLGCLPEKPSSLITPAFPSFSAAVSESTYRQRINACREAIRQGESYELTLTTAFTSTLPPETDPFDLYLRLRSFNPAFYSTYMSLPCLCIHVLSSSPERFLRIDKDRRVEMMPIKGTRARVKAGECVCGLSRGCGGVARGSQACLLEAMREDIRRGEDLGNDCKEKAENRMIVDLIRSDLVSCCIPSTVKVPKLIALESYGVHNLVTTVQGTLAENVGSVEAVKRCFPPGSMTGAPKLRSVEILDKLEGHCRRGIYSGALGYFSVDGVTDLSVVIRTIVIEGNCMSIGAGGAITWLSDSIKEWDEVLTKVRSVVGSVVSV